MEKEWRRSKSTLHILGAGVIGFALWDIVKMLLVMVMIAPETDSSGAEELRPLLADLLRDENLLFALLIPAALGLLTFLTIGLRIRIGRAARDEGLGRPHRGYLGLAFVFFAFQAVYFMLSVWSAFSVSDTTQTPLQIAASLILELFSLVTMGEVCFTARKVRKLNLLTEKAG